MGGSSDLGRGLMAAGAVLLVLGALLAFAPRPSWLGRLPGDIVYRRGGFTLYLPLATCLLLSLLATLLLALLRRH